MKEKQSIKVIKKLSIKKLSIKEVALVKGGGRRNRRWS